MPTSQRTDDDRVERLLTELAATSRDDPRWEGIRAELVRLHIPLVRHLARRYTGGSEPREDIEQAAMVGLVKAINRFDPSYGAHFVGFAMPTMLGEVKRHFRDHSWAVRMPRRLQELHLTLRTARQDFTARHGRPPTVAEISAIVGVTEEETIEALSAIESQRTVSLDAPVTDDEQGVPYGELIGGDDTDLENVVDRAALRPLLESLPDRERTILLHRFFGNKTQAEIADLLGISQMHVSRLIARTVRDLRRQLLQDA
jgi:RNA polymerase sigma-B factor